MSMWTWSLLYYLPLSGAWTVTYGKKERIDISLTNTDILSRTYAASVVPRCEIQHDRGQAGHATFDMEILVGRTIADETDTLEELLVRDVLDILFGCSLHDDWAGPEYQLLANTDWGIQARELGIVSISVLAVREGKET